MKRVAVVGGGIFGATAAIHLARIGHEVHLFEKQHDLLQAASRINQYRLHRGYHYPRSSDTARSCRDAEYSFREEYGDAIISDNPHLYGIARERSKTSTETFLAFCQANALEYRMVKVHELINPDVADVVEVVEQSFDFAILLSSVRKKLFDTGVQVHLAARVDNFIMDQFDKIVLAAYAYTNNILSKMGRMGEEYQYEVCEKPVVSLPTSFGKTDIVIIDGPFMSVGPMGRTGAYVLGNVEHAMHFSNIGLHAQIPIALQPYLNRGVIENPSHTRFAQFIESGVAFIPTLAQARHIGSMYTVRAVLPYRDDTDERPTLVTQVDDRLIKIFSGKIPNCVEAARIACSLI
jgi:hypothetical protein